MKRQTVSILLSAAIFTTTSLFAMDEENSNQERSITHKRPEHGPNLLYQNINIENTVNNGVWGAVER